MLHARVLMKIMLEGFDERVWQRTKLPGIVAAKRKVPLSQAGVQGEGNSESKPPLGGHRLTMDVWTTMVYGLR